MPASNIRLSLRQSCPDEILLSFIHYTVYNSYRLFPGEIPDAAFIHAARKKRQMARELGDFTPHDNEPGTGRLVREDENDASDDEDDDEKRRIVFSVKEKSQRQKIAEEIGNLI